VILSQSVILTHAVSRSQWRDLRPFTSETPTPTASFNEASRRLTLPECENGATQSLKYDPVASQSSAPPAAAQSWF
jgi:hypothetical protein